MSANDRFERRLPVILDSLAPTRAPEYFDDILGQVDRTRQRPGWTFPERWLPVSALTNRLAVTPRIPMRAAIAVLLLIVGLVVGALLIAGSRQRVPPPFGPAANGQIMFIDEAGAIRSGNPVDGTSSIIVAGSGNRLPIMSPDGTRLAYLSANDLVVTDPQGQDPIVVATRRPPGHLVPWLDAGQRSRHRRPVDREARGVRRRCRRQAEPDARLRQCRRLAQRPRRSVPAAGRRRSPRARHRAERRWPLPPVTEWR